MLFQKAEVKNFNSEISLYSIAANPGSRTGSLSKLLSVGEDGTRKILMKLEKLGLLSHVEIPQNQGKASRAYYISDSCRKLLREVEKAEQGGFDELLIKRKEQAA